jgi:hypothetical protein
MEVNMLRFNTFFVTLFVLLMTLWIGTIHIVEAHTDLENAKSEYALKLGEYTEAYGYWETAERQVGDLQNYKQVVSSEWSSNLEDLGENALDALGISRSDIPNMIAATIKTVADLFDNNSLVSTLSEIQTQIDNIAITIPQLKSDRDTKKVAMENARADYRALLHRCGGCNRLFETDPSGTTNHRPMLCAANHIYYACQGSDMYDMHTTTTSCPTGHQMLTCQVSGHDHRCSGCQNLYNPWNSVLVDAHRVRTCYDCNQSFRECDSNLYCSESLTWTHSGY